MAQDSLGAQRSVCVYCGSRPGADPAFMALARAVGAGLGARGLRLVYGAGDVGLMGEVARAAMAAGAPALGVIPQHLLDLEVGKRDLTELVVVQTMHQRKTLMFEQADAVLALPGGAGTLDEVVEVLTWRQLGLHAKPIVLADVNGFWAPFVSLLRHCVDSGFASNRLLDFVTLTDGAEAALDAVCAR
jgi:uncharacterized protein (TIGR00730 family)